MRVRVRVLVVVFVVRYEKLVEGWYAVLCCVVPHDHEEHK